MITATPDGRITRTQIVREPYWVSPHAMRRYRERVDRRISEHQALEAIQRGLQGQAPAYPVTRTIAIADRAARFVAIVEPPTPEREWPQVVTVWRWGLCPILLRRKRCAGGDKRYRYLNAERVAGIPAAVRAVTGPRDSACPAVVRIVKSGHGGRR